MRGTRPPWYRTARSIGGQPWVPFEVARSLQDQIDTHRARLQQVERDLDQAYQQRITELEDALGEAAERLADCEPAPSEDAERILRLRQDLARVQQRTERDIAAARRAERTDNLLRLAAVLDDLQRGMQALPQDPSSPWFQGYHAIVKQLEAQLAQAGATPFGTPGDPFDPTIHEAVGTTPGEIDRVVGVVRSGLAMDDGSLLRPAQVVVGA
jgi:molecular chaperone GrpE